jgi:hypothetical protein
MSISGQEYMKMKKDGLKGYKANCECFDELKIE